MIETLNSMDLWLFMFVNVTMSNVVTDFIMPIVTSDVLLRVAYALGMIYLLIIGPARTRWLVLTSLLVLLIADQLSSNFLKPLIERPRPCNTLEHINLLVNCGAGWSLPSSHAANAFAQAVLFALIMPRTKTVLLGIAALVALSRVYVGVHYPFDIISGALVGSAVGWLIARLFIRLQPETPVLAVEKLGESNAPES